VDEFHRIEIVWRTKEQALSEAEKLKERYKHIFEDIMELRWRMAWVTPWFMAQEGKTGLSEMSGAGTVDYEAVLPYNGNWIEFQNLSVNGEKYPKGFTVKAQSGDPLVGMQRRWPREMGIGILEPEGPGHGELARGLQEAFWGDAERDQVPLINHHFSDT
jgi:hypothetical protein